MSKKLTAISLAHLPTGDYADPIIPGLVFRVGAKRRTWTYRYRVGDKQSRDSLGYFLGEGVEGSLGLAAAREAARQVAQRVEIGAPVAPAPAHPKVGGLTLGEMIDRYEVIRKREGGRIKTLDHALTSVRNGLADYLKLPAKQFSKSDLRRARDDIAKTAPIMANRLLGYLGPIMRWSAQEDLIPVNFVRDLRKAPERKRERVLSRKELKAVWNASYELGNSVPATNFGAMIRFLICTAQRVGEAQAMRHGDVLGGIWKQSDNKASRDHRLKLPKLALAQMGVGEARDLVFPGEAGTKVGAVSKFKAALDKASNVSDWRVHDIRRTAASIMQEIGVPESSIRAVLNHQLVGVSQVYLRGELDAFKAKALADWNDQLAKIVALRAA